MSRLKEKAAQKHSPRDTRIVSRNGGNVSKRIRWTEEQDLFLMTNANKGAAWCAHQICMTYGVKRSAEATQRHGTRIGVSWVRYEICPECGKPVLSISTRAGVCKDCNAKHLRDAAKAKAEQAAYESTQDGQNETFNRYRREYDMYRSRLRRTRRATRAE